MVDRRTVLAAAGSTVLVFAALAVGRTLGLIVSGGLDYGPGVDFYVTAVPRPTIESAVAAGVLVGLVVEDARDATLGVALGVVAGLVLATVVSVLQRAFLYDTTVAEIAGAVPSELGDLAAVSVETLLAGVVCVVAAWWLRDRTSLDEAIQGDAAAD